MEKPFNSEVHLAEMEKALDGLLNISQKLASPAPMQLQYLGTAVDNTAGGVVSAYNSLSETPKRLKFTHHDNWKSLMGSVHRNFFNSIVAVTEQGLKDWVISEKLQVTISKKQQLEKLIQSIEDTNPLTKRQKNKLLSFVGNIPGFMDYFETVAYKLGSQRQKIWRDWFTALLIIRNLASHSNRELTDSEIEKLELGGFGAAINGRIISLNTSAYVPIIERIMDFYKEVFTAYQPGHAELT